MDPGRPAQPSIWVECEPHLREGFGVIEDSTVAGKHLSGCGPSARAQENYAEDCPYFPHAVDRPLDQWKLAQAIRESAPPMWQLELFLQGPAIAVFVGSGGGRPGKITTHRAPTQGKDGIRPI